MVDSDIEAISAISVIMNLSKSWHEKPEGPPLIHGVDSFDVTLQKNTAKHYTTSHSEVTKHAAESSRNGKKLQKFAKDATERAKTACKNCQTIRDGISLACKKKDSTAQDKRRLADLGLPLDKICAWWEKHLLTLQMIEDMYTNGRGSIDAASVEIIALPKWNAIGEEYKRFSEIAASSNEQHKCCCGNCGFWEKYLCKKV